MSIKSLFQNIADAIKNVYGTTDTLTPAEMPQAINNFNSIFQTKNLSTPIEGQTTVEGCLNKLSENKYKILSAHPTENSTASITIPEEWIEANIVAQFETDTVATLHIINGMPKGCAYRFSLNQATTLAYGYVWFSNTMRFSLDGFTRTVNGNVTDLKNNTNVLFQILYR